MWVKLIINSGVGSFPVTLTKILMWTTQRQKETRGSIDPASDHVSTDTAPSWKGQEMGHSREKYDQLPRYRFHHVPYCRKVCLMMLL